MIRYDRLNRRVWVLGARVHHGLVGVFLIGFGVILVLDDLHDFPWLRDNP
jgi:hypothetical protein